MKKLTILTTGGTIDKIYFDDKSDYQIGEPQIGQTLRDLDVSFDFEVEALMRKDSLHLNDADRSKIKAAATACDTNHILITHGTDTMVETAKCLLSIPNRTIVITGSLQPARFRDSDAVFNIGCAVGAVQSLPEGVWIVMNGRIWNPLTVVKNVSKNRFELISDK